MLSLALLAGGLATAAGEPVDVGADAPKIKATDQAGNEIDFAKIYEKGMTLVYFYPKADTPGCTKQACSLRDAYESLTDKGIHVIGVSMDTVEDQKAFTDKYKLPFTLVADKDGKVVKAFGVPEMRPGFAARQAFLVKDGKIVWRDLTAATDKQAEEVMDALKDIK